MESLFAQLGSVVQALLSCLPHLVHVPANCRGVLFYFGHATVVNPGVHVYLPVCMKVEKYCTSLSSEDLRPQSLMTKDGQVICLCGTATYRIVDVKTAVIECWDPIKLLKNEAELAIRTVVTSSTLNELQHRSDELDEKFTKTCQEVLRKYGVLVEKIQLSDLSLCQTIRFFGDSTVPNPASMSSVV